jgi:hypothetical protein
LGLGRAYLGDPALFKGDLDFRTEDGYTMGRVVASDAESHTIKIKITDLPHNSLVNVVDNGDIYENFIAEKPTLEKEITIPATGRTFVRLGVWTEGGRGILFTNPIYFVPQSEVGKIPKHRLAITN